LILIYDYRAGRDIKYLGSGKTSHTQGSQRTQLHFVTELSQ
jgi:hypothetical protein